MKIAAYREGFQIYAVGDTETEVLELAKSRFPDEELYFEVAPCSNATYDLLIDDVSGSINPNYLLVDGVIEIEEGD